MKFRCPSVETHVTHACNLRCSSCSHFSDYHFRGHMSVEQAEEWFGGWGARLQPTWFSLLGGEPTMNPYLLTVTRLARKHFPESCLRIVTNGWFLHRFPELPSLLQECKVRLEWSIHHKGEEYEKKSAAIRQLLAEWRKQWTFELLERPSYARWRRLYLRREDAMLPFSSNDEEAAWKVCTSKACTNLHEGKLWKCPPVAYLPMVASKFDIDKAAWKLWLDYQPLEPGCSDEELRAFFQLSSSPICSLCPNEINYFRPRSPITGRVDLPFKESKDA